MNRLIILGLLAGLAGCSSKSLDRDKARDHLSAQARDFCRALLAEDHDRVASLTHHNVLDGVGGKAAFSHRLRERTEDQRPSGIRCTNLLIGEPTELFEAGREVYAAIPIELRLSRRDGVMGNKSTFLIAASTDRGANWVFVEGDSVGDDRSRLRKMLPNAPDRLPLKAVSGARWEE